MCVCVCVCAHPLCNCPCHMLLQALATVFARQDTLVAMAATKAKADEQRAIEEKERTLK